MAAEEAVEAAAPVAVEVVVVATVEVEVAVVATVDKTA